MVILFPLDVKDLDYGFLIEILIELLYIGRELIRHKQSLDIDLLRHTY